MSTPFLYALSFGTNALILVFEIAGGRLLAPYLGTSVEVWAGLIAVVLGGMALGYHFGGRFGDTDASQTRIGLVLGLAGCFALVAWGVRDYIPSAIAGAHISLTASALLVGGILFMPTIILLAAVSPLLAKNLVTRLDSSARIVGTLNAVGTLGSIAGAILTGAFLIPHFGVRSILLGVAVALCLAACIVVQKQAIRLAAVFAVVGAVSFGLDALPSRTDGLIADISSAYSRIFITREQFRGEDVLALRTSLPIIQCLLYVDENGIVDEARTVAPYLRAHSMVMSHLLPNGPARALFLGGCAGTFPRNLSLKYPNMMGTVVEIDPAMIQAGREYFGFRDSAFPNLSFVYEDARLFANDRHEPYDVVFLDAFSSSVTVPFQLVTEEMFVHLAEHVSNDGVLIVNIISSYAGDGLIYSSAFVKTARTAFPHVALYQSSNSPEKIQNLVIVASPARELPQTISSAQYPEITLSQIAVLENVITMTDDYAPVEGLSPRNLLRNN